MAVDVGASSEVTHLGAYLAYTPGCSSFVVRSTRFNALANTRWAELTPMGNVSRSVGWQDVFVAMISGPIQRTHHTPCINTSGMVDSKSFIKFSQSSKIIVMVSSGPGVPWRTARPAAPVVLVHCSTVAYIGKSLPIFQSLTIRQTYLPPKVTLAITWQRYAKGLI